MLFLYEGQWVGDWCILVEGGQCGVVFCDGVGDWIEGWIVCGFIGMVWVSIDGLVEICDMVGVLCGYCEMVYLLVYLCEMVVIKLDEVLIELVYLVQVQDMLDLVYCFSVVIGEMVEFVLGVM